MDDRIAPEPDAGRGTNGFGPRNRSTVRFVVSIMVALIAGVALYIVQPGWFAAPAATSPVLQPIAATPTPTPTPKPAPVRDPYIGGARLSDGVKLTVRNVQYYSGIGTNRANEGDTYAIVTLRIENLQGKDYTVVPDVSCSVGFGCHWYIRDGEGHKNPPVAYDPFHTKIRPVVLQNGSHIDGSYTFEVPLQDAERHTLQLLYYHAPLEDANSVLHWILKSRPREY